MLKNKKGFTLVELLAVIVILAIILAIAIPGISGIINRAKKGAFESNVKMIITGIEYKIVQFSVDPSVEIPIDGADILATLANYGANTADYTTATLVSKNPVKITIISASTSKFGVYTATNATKASITVTP